MDFKINRRCWHGTQHALEAKSFPQPGQSFLLGCCPLFSLRKISNNCCPSRSCVIQPKPFILLFFILSYPFILFLKIRIVVIYPATSTMLTRRISRIFTDWSSQHLASWVPWQSHGDHNLGFWAETLTIILFVFLGSLVFFSSYAN